MNSFKRLRAFQIELEFRSVGFWGEGKTGVPGEKPLGARERTNNKLNQHMASTPGVEPGPHWWESSALTTAPHCANTIVVKYRQGHGFLLNMRSESFWNSDKEKVNPPTPPPNKTSLIISLFLITFSQFLPLVIEVLRILPLMICLFLYWQTGRRRYLVIGILTFFGLLILLTFTALIPTGSKNPGRLERIAR